MKYLIVFTLIVLSCGCYRPSPPPLQQQCVPPPPPHINEPKHQSTPKIEGTYHGDWITTNRPLDGHMKCDVTDLGGQRWKGRFYGIWMGRKFDYVVDWSGPPNSLKGFATIDGATYHWTGVITHSQFKGTFSGSRYTGSFNLKK